MKTGARRRRRWKETQVALTRATALILEGPGAEWLLLVRGERGLREARELADVVAAADLVDAGGRSRKRQRR